MPYIITTTTPRPGMVPGEAILVRTPPLVSRRAVATLDGARESAAGAVQAMVETHVEPDGLGLEAEAQEPYFTTALNLPEQGGTIGPLPDGTVIEVEPATYPQIGIAAGLPGPTGGYDPSQPSSKQTILNTYNTREEATQ